MWQNPNPIDLLFFAAEYALERLGVPGFCGCMELWLSGRLDLGRLRTAVTALGDAFPVLNATLDTHPITGRVRWRLPKPGSSPRIAVRCSEMPPEDGIEALVNERRAAFHEPPLAFHVFRGAPEGDVLMMFWTHALMDGGGGLALLAVLDQLYRERTAPGTLASRGDERRRDFEQHLLPGGMPARIAAVLRGGRAKPPPRESRQLNTSPYPRDWGRMRILRRRIERSALEQAEAIARSIGAGVRLSDWLRTSAFAALDALLPRRRDRLSAYTMLSPIDHRDPASPAVCWNFNSALPLSIPTADLADRAEVARELRRQMTAHKHARTAEHDALHVWLTTRLPTAWIGSIFRAEFLPGRSPRRTIGPRQALSIPFGIMKGCAEARFCEHAPRSFTAYRIPLPQPGFAIDTTLSERGLEIVGTCLDGRTSIELLTRIVEHFVAFALRPPTEGGPIGSRV